MAYAERKIHMSNAASKSWFEVDRKGLAKIVERRGKIALLHELVGNALDADGVTRVEVELIPEEGVPQATIVVRDDAPDGFADLTHAWTLFAESNRKAYPSKRGRFNLGEKLVLALCNEASIISTKGGVLFDHRGRTSTRTKRERGSEFQGIARITRAELAEAEHDLKRVIPPAGVTITVNGKVIPARLPICSFEATLPTELADEDGVLRRSSRKTIVRVYEPLPGTVPMLHELGIPVVETGDKWDLSIEQKCLLNMDRDNVTPAYLRTVRTLVVNALHDRLDPADANTPLVNEALADDDASPETVRAVLDLKYGEKRAIFDPSDLEANMNLVADGYTLIKGGQLTGDQWTNAKRHDQDLRPSGQIRPTKKALFGPDGKDTWVLPEKWSASMCAVVSYAAKICKELLGQPIAVAILSDITESWSACFGAQGLVFNLGRLGHDFFNQCAEGPSDALNELLIHELGHGMPGGENHLSSAYHDGLCKLAARLARLALARPALFAWERG